MYYKILYPILTLIRGYVLEDVVTKDPNEESTDVTDTFSQLNVLHIRLSRHRSATHGL